MRYFFLFVLLITTHITFSQSRSLLEVNASVDLPTQSKWKTGYGADVTFSKQLKSKRDAFTVSLGTHHFNYKLYEYVNQIIAFRAGFQFFPKGNFYVHPTLGIMRQYLKESDFNMEIAWGVGVGYLAPLKKGAINSFVKLYGGKSSFTWYSIGLGYQFALNKK